MDDTATVKARRYADRRYRGLDQRIVHTLESRRILDALDQAVGPGDRVLDMPCGYGRFTPALLERGLAVAAGDADPARLDLLAERVDTEIPRWCLRAEALPFEDDTFDAVLCVRLIQHLKDRDLRLRVFAEMARVTRGRIIATVYRHTPLHRATNVASQRSGRLYYRDDDLLAELRTAGLRLRRLTRPMPGLHAQTVVVLEPVPRAA